MKHALQQNRTRALHGTTSASWGVAIVLLVLALTTYGWVGPTDSDDLLYAGAAREWVQHFPYVSTNHWGLRHVIVLPMALLFRLFGESEATLAAPSLAYLAALLLLTFLCMRRVADTIAALLATALIVTVPLVSSGVSIVTTDLPEMFFDLASLWTFYFATRQPRWWLFLLCGILAGLGFLTRETSIILLILYGLAFLAGFGRTRANYIWMGMGFALIFGLDTLFLFWGSGDPLWRFHVSLRGVKNDNPSMANQFKTVPGFDRFGSLAAPRWLQPFLVLFVNQNFGPYFWLAVPGAFAALYIKEQGRRHLAILFGSFGLIWFLLTSYVLLSLWVLARYELIVAVTIAVPLALTLAQFAHRGHRLVIAGAVTVLVLGNLALIGAANRQPLFGERALVAFARRSEGPVLTDPSTLRSARWLLEANGLDDRVAVGLPRPGTTYVFSSSTHRELPADWPVRQPSPDWEQVATIRETSRWPSLVVHWLGLRHVLPPGLAQKLDPAPRWATLYRIPATSGGQSTSVQPD